MPLNERKIIGILMEECAKVGERYDGYQADLVHAISDIMAAEQAHRVQRTNIQQKVNDVVNATGQLLADKRR